MTDLLNLINFVSDAWYIGCLAAWHILLLLPWPGPRQYFGSIVLFVALYYPRNILEGRFLKKIAIKPHANGAPTASDHQAAASVVEAIVHG